MTGNRELASCQAESPRTAMFSSTNLAPSLKAEWHGPVEVIHPSKTGDKAKVNVYSLALKFLKDEKTYLLEGGTVGGLLHRTL
jgi:hypothetical protein